MKITFNGNNLSVNSVEELWRVLNQFSQEPQFELWLLSEAGRSIAMLRNNEYAWLMYLRFNGDSGVVTKGRSDLAGTQLYTLANGEVNEIPLSWCIEIAGCYKAIAYFFVTDGARSESVAWQEA